MYRLTVVLAASAQVAYAEPPVPAGVLDAPAGNGEFLPFAKNPILKRGETGSWDSWAVGSMSVVRAGDVYHMYYEGWGEESIEIGHATSPDGIHWTKDPANPVIGRSPEGWDSGGTWDPYVIYEDGIFKMWYGATPRGRAKGNFHWGYAESRDGSQFERRGRISHATDAEYEDDHVIHDRQAKRYYMYYWDRNAEPAGLFRAESKNETDFDFENAVPLAIAGRDPSQMYKFTHVVQEAGKWFMFYGEFVRPRCNDCQIGLATSRDGIQWQTCNNMLLLGQDGELMQVANNLYYLYYGPDGFFDGEGCDIRLAVMRGNISQLVREVADRNTPSSPSQ